MAESVGDYEKVSIYPLDDAKREELLRAHAECTFLWSTRDGWPVGGHRIEAIRRDPRVSLVVTSTGSALGPGKSVTAKRRVTVREDADTKRCLEVAPEKWITCDGAKVCAPKSSDAERLACELARRGLA